MDALTIDAGLMLAFALAFAVLVIGIGMFTIGERVDLAEREGEEP